jgi:hypothetical protein
MGKIRVSDLVADEFKPSKLVKLPKVCQAPVGHMRLNQLQCRDAIELRDVGHRDVDVGRTPETDPHHSLERVLSESTHQPSRPNARAGRSPIRFAPGLTIENLTVGADDRRDGLALDQDLAREVGNAAKRRTDDQDHHHERSDAKEQSPATCSRRRQWHCGGFWTHVGIRAFLSCIVCVFLIRGLSLSTHELLAICVPMDTPFRGGLETGGPVIIFNLFILVLGRENTWNHGKGLPPQELLGLRT